MIKNVSLVRISPWYGYRHIHPHDTLPPFSIGYIATMLNQKGLKIQIIDTLVEKFNLSQIDKLINGHESDIVIIDTTSSTDRILTELVQKLKSHQKILVWCIGQYASTLSGVLLKKNPLLDGCIIGEPENTVVDLVECLNKGYDLYEVDGLAFYDKNNRKIITTQERKFIDDLDLLPAIDYTYFKHDRYKVFSAHIPILNKWKWGFLLTSRGCPHKCIYCSPTLRQSYGTYYRSNSSDVVVTQMEGLIKNYGVNTIAFQDDNFPFDKQRTIAICKKIIDKGMNIKWIIQARADCLDEEILYFLKKAGCVYIGLGVESGNDRILSLLKKGEDKAIIRQAVKQIQNAGIFVIAFFMIGNPTETYQEIIDTFNFIKELHPMMIQIAFFTVYPGTSDYNILQESSRLDYENMHHYDSVRLNTSKISIKDLLNFQKYFYLRYYLSPKYIFKYFKYRAFYALFNNQELKLVSNVIKYFLFN